MYALGNKYIVYFNNVYYLQNSPIETNQARDSTNVCNGARRPLTPYYPAGSVVWSLHALAGLQVNTSLPV